jgi:fructokinase
MIIAGGELLVEFVSHELGCGLARTVSFSGPYPSGAPAIFADQAARVGADVQLFGCIGRDPFGDLLINRLKTDRVDVHQIARSTDRTTGTAFVSYHTDGSRVFVFHLDGTAADQIEAAPVILPGTLLHVSGASLGNPRLRAVILEAVDQAQTMGRVSYDPNIRPELMQDPSIRPCIDQIMGASDVLLPSREDLEALYPGTTPEAFIRDMLGAGKKAVVVKRGAMGAIGSNGGPLITVPPHLVDEVDPTGAGDCFCGTLLGLLDQGQAFEYALRAANVAGALHVTRRGPMEWNPTLADLRPHLEPAGV